MTTTEDLCNRALAEVTTRSTIASITEGSAEANQCQIHYDPTRDSLLRAHPWAFARAQKSLSLQAAAAGTAENPAGTSTLPEQPWSYSYFWPADCLRFRRIYQPVSGGSAIAYTLSTWDDSANATHRVILTNQAQAQLVYTRRITDPNLFDVDFADALVFQLAARMAGSLTGDKSLVQALAAQAQQIILAARVVDDVENGQTTEILPDWLTIRGYSGGGGGDSTGLINAVIASS